MQNCFPYVSTHVPQEVLLKVPLGSLWYPFGSMLVMSESSFKRKATETIKTTVSSLAIKMSGNADSNECLCLENMVFEKAELLKTLSL